MPDDEGEDGEAQGPERCSCGIDAGGGPAASFVVVPGFSLALFLVSGDEGSGGREDGRKGEEESSDGRTEMFSDDAGGGGDESSEEEPDGVFVGLGDLDGIEIDVNAHRVSPEEDGPETEGNAEPDRHAPDGCELGGRTVAHEHVAHSDGVEEERDGSENHRARFGGRVFAAVAGNGETDGGEGDRRCRSEEASEGFGAEDVSKDGEEADYRAADEEAEEEVAHLRRPSGPS